MFTRPVQQFRRIRLAVLRPSSIARMFLAVFICGAPVAGFAQGPARSTQPDRTVPGFVVVDGALMSIEHTSALQSTSISIFSSIRNDDLLPRDLAVEVLPWFSTAAQTPRNLVEAYRQIYGSLTRSFLQSLAVSMAISQDIRKEGAADGTAYATVGIRAFALTGRPPRELLETIKRLQEKSEALDAALRRDDSQPDSEASPEVAGLFSEVRELSRTLRVLDKGRKGLLVEVGSGTAFEVPNNLLSQASVGRKGLWITPIYRFEAVPVDVSATFRSFMDNRDGVSSRDIGVRVNAIREGVSYSVEALGRIRNKVVTTHDADRSAGRVVGGVTYGLNRTASINLAFGKNFSDNYSGGGSFVGSFGLTLGLRGILPDNE